MAGEADGGIDPGREALLRALRDGGVRFVLIGGAALESHADVKYSKRVADRPKDRAYLERVGRLGTCGDCR